MKVYIVCPANFHTGGMTLLHQLCKNLRDISIDACMAYFISRDTIDGQFKQHESYKDLGCPYVSIDEIRDDSSSWLVITETDIELIKRYQHIRIFLWWLSVDFYALKYRNFYQRVLGKIEKIHVGYITPNPSIYQGRDEFSNPRVVHLVQSQYANCFVCAAGARDECVRFLGDYLEPNFLHQVSISNISQRNNVVLYNPKKMGRITNQLLTRKNNFTMIAIENMTPYQVQSIMLQSKAYIDFGNHPGMDRLPREAAICGCCIITGMRGSAAYQEDVPIPSSFKFHDGEDVRFIENKLSDICENYDENANLFSAYRSWIESQESQFRQDLAKIAHDYLMER